MTKTRYMVNDPRASFDAHLFEREKVEDAEGADGEMSERSVTPLCSRTTSYGPFRPVTVDEIRSNLPDHEGDVCGVCKSSFKRRDAEDE